MIPKGGKSTSIPIFTVPADLMLSTVCAIAGSEVTPAKRPAPITAITIRLEIVMLPTLSVVPALPPAGIPSACRGTGEFHFHTPCQHGKRPAKDEIDRRNRSKHHERTECGVIDDLPLARQLGKSDDRRKRRSLDKLHEKADRRGDGDPGRLRQDDVAHAIV